MRVKKIKNLVILVTIDCFRYDHPRLSSLKHLLKEIGETISLESRSHSSLTWFSIPVILSGFPIFRARKGWSSNINSRFNLPKFLRNLGFVTVGFPNNPSLGPQRGYNLIFDVLFWNNSSKKRYETNMDSLNKKSNNLFKLGNFFKRPEILSLASSINSIRLYIKYSYVSFVNSHLIIELMFSLLENLHDVDNLFVWLHLMDLHFPYSYHLNPMVFISSTSYYQGLNELSTHSFDRFLVRELYNSYVKSFDYIRDFFKSLSEIIHVFADNFVVAIIGDHGDEFGERRVLGHSGIKHKKHPLKILRYYDTLIKTPLFLCTNCKFNIEDINEIGISSFSVNHIDLVPTILELVGILHPISSDDSKIRKIKKVLNLLPGTSIFSNDIKHKSNIIVGPSFSLLSVFENKFFGRTYVFFPNNYKIILHPYYGIEIYDIEKDMYEVTNLYSILPLKELANNEKVSSLLKFAKKYEIKCKIKNNMLKFFY